jgi:drug/metabolite transporter (DMT)-like permease
MSGIISNVSIRKSDITLREPILALRIPLTAFLGVIVLEEHLAGTQVIGIGMIFVGVLLATWKGWKRSDLLTPEGGWVVLSAWVSSVAFLIDKVALGHFTPVLYAFFMFLFPGLVQAIFLSPTYRRSVTVCKRHFGQLFMLGVLCASIYWVNLEIMSQLPLSIAYSITQIGVVATVIGAVFVLHERERLWFRVAGVLIVCVGALLFKVV